MYRHFGHGDVDDQAVALVKLRNGSAIQLDVSWEAFARDEGGLEVFGTKGGARSDPLTIYSTLGGKPAVTHPMSVQPKEFVYSNFETLALFVERINKGDESLSRPERAWHSCGHSTPSMNRLPSSKR